MWHWGLHWACSTPLLPSLFLRIFCLPDSFFFCWEVFYPAFVWTFSSICALTYFNIVTISNLLLVTYLGSRQETSKNLKPKIGRMRENKIMTFKLFWLKASLAVQLQLLGAPFLGGTFSHGHTLDISLLFPVLCCAPAGQICAMKFSWVSASASAVSFSLFTHWAGAAPGL